MLWIYSFLSNRSTFLSILELLSGKFFLDTGIPQGSPISPILFLFFTSPLIEMAEQVNLHRVTLYILAFVDDTYLMTVSCRYRFNCLALEAFHHVIMTWARPAGILFGPDKYHVMHFKAPYTSREDCKLLPNIPGLNVENEPRKVLEILGVMVDASLRWQDHIDEIEKKVEKQMRYLRRIAGATWGPSLVRMRQLYAMKIRPIITYACGAWFVFSHQVQFIWSLSKQQIHQLERLQHRCLRWVAAAGAFGNTCGKVLEKELHIESLEVLLDRLAMTQRATVLESPEHMLLVFIRGRPRPGRDARTHPYHELDAFASVLRAAALMHLVSVNGEEDSRKRWANPIGRDAVIRAYAKQEATVRSAERWDQYRDERVQKGKRQIPAVVENWGKKSLGYYSTLTRAECTMLLQCRTEFIGFNSHLFRTACVDSGLCSCGQSQQTVFHMFVECTELEEERDLLRRQLGHTQVSRLLTKDAKAAAGWAISHFDIDQFEWPRQLGASVD
ncbi:hypothetical protein FDECE_18391 [Fusarium decemcellulare]|nr:hypothetical protein FDECE_18391 [Fusarium decemcellulare]